MTAGAVLPREGGLFYATDVRIEMYTEDGVVEGVITAESCNFDWENQVATSTEKVSYERDGLHI